MQHPFKRFFFRRILNNHVNVFFIYSFLFWNVTYCIYFLLPVTFMKGNKYVYLLEINQVKLLSLSLFFFKDCVLYSEECNAFFIYFDAKINGWYEYNKKCHFIIDDVCDFFLMCLLNCHSCNKTCCFKFNVQAELSHSTFSNKKKTTKTTVIMSIKKYICLFVFVRCDFPPATSFRMFTYQCIL